MRNKIVFLFIVLWCGFAHAQLLGTTSGNNPIAPLSISSVSYVGPIANGTGLPNNLLSVSSESMMTRKAHIMRSATSRVQLIYTNYYVPNTINNNFGLETSVGNSINVTPWIEYPVGTYTEVPCAASDPCVIADKTNKQTDFVNVSIPDGAVFYTWTLVSGNGGNNFPYYTPTGSVVGNPLWFGMQGWGIGAEAANAGTSGVPVTPGTITDNNNGERGYWPAAVEGDTTQPTFCLIGDSRVIGVKDAEDPSYDLGDLARSIGPTTAYLNMGIPGDRQAGFVFASTLRFDLMRKSGCTAIVNELGVNDFYQQNITTPTGSTASWEIWQQFLTAHIYNSFPTLPYYRTTMEPCTTSSDSFLTTANQTFCAASINADVTTANDWVRSSVDGVPYIDLSDFTSTSRDSGLWNVDPLGVRPTYYTPDGLHENRRSNLLIKKIGNINPRTLAATPPVSVSYPSVNLTGSTPTYTTGYFGGTQAASFTATQADTVYGVFPGVPPATIECWFKVSSIPVGGSGYLCGMTGSLIIEINSTTGLLSVHFPTGSITNSALTVTDGNWHNVRLDVYVPVGQTNLYYYLYVDCNLMTNFPVILNTGSLYWPDRIAYTVSGAHLAGLITEASIWNIPLDQASCTLPTNPYVGNEAGLVGLWHLNGNLNGIRGPAGM